MGKWWAPSWTDKKKSNHSDNKVQMHNRVKTNTYILFSPHNWNAEYYWREKVGKQQQCCCIHKWRKDIMGCRVGLLVGVQESNFELKPNTAKPATADPSNVTI